MSITTILQVYKRPQYLQEQIDAINSQTVKSDALIIVHNEGGAQFNFDLSSLHPNTQLVYANPNMKYHLRYAVGLLTKTDYVAMFDDDTIPGSRWYENCLNTIAKHDCVCVSNGRIVDRKNMRQYGPGWGSPSDQERRADFGGHSLFLRTKNLKYMWFDDVIEHNNGEDIMLSANLQRFGNIPTFVPPHPQSDHSLWGSLKGMQLGSDPVASYIVNPAHHQERFKLFDEYVKRGWKLLLE